MQHGAGNYLVISIKLNQKLLNKTKKIIVNFQSINNRKKPIINAEKNQTQPLATTPSNRIIIAYIIILFLRTPNKPTKAVVSKTFYDNSIPPYY